MNRFNKLYIVPLLVLGVALSLSLTPTKASAPALPDPLRDQETAPSSQAEAQADSSAGLPEPEPQTQDPPAEDSPGGGEASGSGAVIPAQQSPVDDSYFDDVVFLGDSRTEGLSLYGGPKNAQYLFSVGATVESVFSKPVAWEDGSKAPLLDTLAQMSCGKVYLMLGVNELGWPKPELYRTQTAKLIDRIRADHPGATVVLQSLPPVSALQEAKGSYINNERIALYNQILRELADEKACVWLDVASALTGADGCLPADWNTDGVHLNVQGCAVWTDYLRTHPVS